MQCGICDNDTKKIKRHCNKKCSKSHPICSVCLQKIILDGCPYCRGNIYFPDTSKTNYFKNLGMIHELAFFRSITSVDLTSRIHKCMAIDQIFKWTYKETELVTNLRTPSDKSITMLGDTLQSTLKMKEEYYEILLIDMCHYLRKVEIDMFEKICYIQGKLYIVQYLQKKCIPDVE